MSYTMILSLYYLFLNLFFIKIHTHDLGTFRAKSYPEAEVVFLQLASKCTLFYIGDPSETSLFARFLDVCVSSKEMYCKQLHNPSEIAPNSQVPELIVDMVGNSSFSKYSFACVVLLPFTPNFHMDGSFVQNIFYKGRVGPDFIFISTPASPRDLELFQVNMTATFFSSYDLPASRSIIFMINESENELFLFCQPCGLKIKKKTWTPVCINRPSWSILSYQETIFLHGSSFSR